MLTHPSAAGAQPSSILIRLLPFFCCPLCGSELDHSSSEKPEFFCVSCGDRFPTEGGIPLFFRPNDWDRSKGDVTEIVKAFYEKYPFPHYDDLDSGASLRRKAERGIFARRLDLDIPHGAVILEGGCGTGQLSNFLGLTKGRIVFGADMCRNSLRLAQGFKERNKIDNTNFVQMNLFRPVFKPETFHLVVSNGVLHATSSPFMAFQSLLGLVKRGGYILIGLYHTYGRVFTDLRRFLFNISGDRLTFLDYRMRDKAIGSHQKESWFQDQYKHPHESKHTISELIGWFERTGTEFIRSIPPCTFFGSTDPDENLFTKKSCGGVLERHLIEWTMPIHGHAEGGFFIVIGRKKAS